MKPTPKMIEVACKAHTPQFDRMDPDLQVYARQQMSAALSAALSVPAAEVVGEPEPIGYCSEYGLDKLASQAHHYCLSVSKAQENEFQFPIYASRISQQDAELERLRREVEASRVRIEALVRALRLAKDHAELEDEVLDIVDDALTINVTNQADACDHKGPLHFFSWGPCCGKCGEPYPFVAAEETGQ